MKAKRKILVISGINTKELASIKKELGCLTDSETVRRIINNAAQGLKA